jgi:tetratricopeptide (TPR) repeat protein
MPAETATRAFNGAKYLTTKETEQGLKMRLSPKQHASTYIDKELKSVALNMKLLFTNCFLVLTLALWPNLGQAQHYKLNKDCAFPAAKRFFNVVADDEPVRDADLDLEPIAHPIAPKVPTAHSIEIAESERAYNDGRLAEAAALLAPFINEQPVNPNVLHHYSRALYRNPATRDKSYATYQRLIRLLDKYGRENPTTTVVYIPFAESYYKLGTLQMDRRQWDVAAYNISRSLLAIQAVPTLGSPESQEQALQYQTECFFHIGNAKICRYFGDRTLRLFPSNRYVQQYLAQLPPLGKTAPKRKP